MSNDAHSYRSIPRAFLDRPDFQSLPDRARHVLLVLKLNISTAGIEVRYPGELTDRVARQTGIPNSGVNSTLRHLEAAGWLQREGNVIWLVGHVDDDPHFRVSDPKHRKSLRAHVHALPHLPIVGRFIAANTAWFADVDGVRLPSYSSHGSPLDGPPKGLRSTRTNTNTNTNNEDEHSSTSSPDGDALTFGDAEELNATRPPGTALVLAASPPTGSQVAVKRTADAIITKLGEVMASVATGARERISIEKVRAAKADLVFSYWAKRLNHEDAIFDSKREKRLLARLKENGDIIHELLYAVDGALRDDWLMGRDQRSTRKYDGIEHIFRDREQVERLADMAPGWRQKVPHPLAVKYAEIIGEAAQHQQEEERHDVAVVAR